VKEEKVIPHIKGMERGEYEAIKYAVAAENLLSAAIPKLKDRFKLFPHRWQMAAAGYAMIKKAVYDLPYSIDHKRAQMLLAELKSMQIEIKFKRIDQLLDKSGLTYVDVNSVIELMNIVANDYCMLCTKEGAEIKHCQLRKAMDGITTWDVDKMSKDGRCPFDGINLATQLKV